MEIVFNRNDKQVELIKAMASKNRTEAQQAQEAFAAFVAPVIQKVLQQMATSALIYKDLEFDENSDPSIPLDLYRDVNEDYIRVWSQTMPGGLPTNITQGLSEFKFTTYPLDSSIAFLKKYAKQARLDVVAAGLKRLSQELLLKQETNAWAPLLYTLANASTNGKAHLINATSAGRFQVDDMSRLATLVKRLYVSWAGGTPEMTDARGLTDIFVSPEITEDIRGFAYQPVTGGGVTNSAGVPAIGLPESVREEIYRNAGTPSIYGVAIHELQELGVNQKYNVLFGEFDNAAGGSFNASTTELVLGVDLTRAAFHRPVEVNTEDGSGQIVVLPDDQYVTRQEKIGMYAKVREGRVITDDRALVGIKV